MRLTIQHVKNCQVEHNNKIISEIDKGLVIYIGIESCDTSQNISDCIKWLTQYINDKKEDVLLLSQFTLFASFKGKKPDFHRAMKNKQALEVFNKIIAEVQENCKFNIKSGIFGEYLKINYCSIDLQTFYIDFNKF